MLTAFLIVFFVILAVLYFDKQKRKIASVSKIPGPPPKPIIGNSLDVGRNTVDIFINLHKLTKQYGPIVKLWMGSSLYLLLSDPKYIGPILTGNDAVKCKNRMKHLAKFTGVGLPTSSGQKWKTDRRLLAPFFTNKTVAQFLPVFNRNGKTLVHELKKVATMEPVDVTETVNSCALNTICNTTMNIDSSLNMEYLEAVNWFLDNAIRRRFSLLRQFDWFYRFTDDYKMEQANLEILNSCAMSIIMKRKEERLTEAKESRQLSLLNTLLDVAEQNEWFTDKDVQAQVQTFIIAGYDTVATAINFGLFELAKHPDVQMKILEELNSVGNDREADLTFENVVDLKYTDCVVREIMRMYPPVGMVERELINNVNFDGHIIPKGTKLILFFNGALNNESSFRDPEQFIPERFLPENVENIPQHAYLAFGEGPRICIGQKFALVEAKILLANIVRAFKIVSMQPQHEPVISMSTVMKSVNGLPIKLKIR